MQLFEPSGMLVLAPAQLRVRDDLNESIRRGRLALETVPCLCGAPFSAMERLSEHDRFGIAQPVVICRECGLIQLNPRMSEGDYRDFYSSDQYRVLYDGEGFREHYRTLLKPQQGQRILWAVQRAGAKLRSVVEIGAGAGWNLPAFQAVGAEVTGWDYSEQLTALGESQGVPMRRGSIAEALAEGIRFDVIILNQVLEHMLDPVPRLRELHGLANPGARLYVGVPATDYPSLGLLQNAHVYYFTDRTLVHYLAQGGWIAGDVVHDDHFGMHTVAQAGAASALSLTGEYQQSLERLRSNRGRVRALERWYRARRACGTVMMHLGVYDTVRSLYRRMKA